MPMNRADYPPDWRKISEHIRFTRARGKCECSGECGAHHEPCSARHGEPHPQTESVGVLTVAHLDHDTTNNDEENLRAMCQKCHLTYDAEYHALNRARRRRREAIAAGQMVLL